MATIRTFVAIPLPESVRAHLEALQQRLRSGPGGAAGRWVRPEGIHLTLKFLGDVPEEEVPRICRAVEGACRGQRAFEIGVGGLGCFPNARRPRVVWAGVREESGRLDDLQRVVEGALETLGYRREGRAFRPHLTLARIRPGAFARDGTELGQVVVADAASELVTFRADEVQVIKSDLRPAGAIYTVLATARLEE
jgi:2'-5' RNA ligase